MKVSINCLIEIHLSVHFKTLVWVQKRSKMLSYLVYTRKYFAITSTYLSLRHLSDKYDHSFLNLP